mgnify:CR=1 FL=1
MKQGRSYFTVIVWILLAAIAAYFVYNVASSLYAPLMTATVTQYEAGAGYYASGFVVRAEEVVTSEYDTTVLACAEGAHVAANDVVATGYRSDDAKTRKTRMDELTGQIEQLQYAWSAASSVYDQAALDNSIADSLSHLSQYLARRDMNSVSDLTPELKGLVLRRTSDAADSASLQLRIDDLQAEIGKVISAGGRVLVTTLTKRMAEDLTDYMREVGIRVKYLHSDIDTLERAEIIRDMRLNVFDVLVGINLLREGLDIPEISLVAILDADKEGFLRSETSLIQTIGRAARNAEGHVIMYADNMTDSMKHAIEETERRRKIQQKYNEEHGITPTTIKKAVRDLIAISKAAEEKSKDMEKDLESMDVKELNKLQKELQKKMHKAAAELNFEEAAQLRDRMLEVKKMLLDME